MCHLLTGHVLVFVNKKITGPSKLDLDELSETSQKEVHLASSNRHIDSK